MFACDTLDRVSWKRELQKVQHISIPQLQELIVAKTICGIKRCVWIQRQADGCEHSFFSGIGSAKLLVPSLYVLL